MTNYQISKNKITVAYNGVGNNFKPIQKDKQVIIKNKYSKQKDFFLLSEAYIDIDSLAEYFPDEGID